MVGPALSRVAANHPVLRAIAVAATTAIIAKSPTPVSAATQQQLTNDIATNLAADPVTVNNLNAETPPNSRTFMGGLTATLGALGTAGTALAAMLGAFGGVASPREPGFWLALIVFLTGGASGSGGALAVVGRLRNDLPPMQRRWWNPMSWLAHSPPAASTGD